MLDVLVILPGQAFPIQREIVDRDIGVAALVLRYHLAYA